MKSAMEQGMADAISVETGRGVNSEIDASRRLQQSQQSMKGRINDEL